MYHAKLSFMAISLLSWIAAFTDAWVVPTVPSSSQTRLSPRPSTSTIRSHQMSSTSLYGWLDGLSPYDSKIPEELKDEIYRAEANTPAAKERGKRVAFLAFIALIGVLFAFFNGFLTELRSGGPDGEPGLVLAESSFAWVVSNPVTTFLFTNSIGGGLCLLLGAGSGLLAEAELDSKRINAEKIYEELERRRGERTRPSSGTPKAQKKMEKAKNKKRRSGKEQKRLDALSEVLAGDSASQEEEAVVAATNETEVASDNDSTATVAEAEETKEEESGDKGLFGGIKDLYKKADSMAASQALLLNKKLEEAGVVDKITDETGLKVIGKEAAEKLAKGKREAEEKQAEKK